MDLLHLFVFTLVSSFFNPITSFTGITWGVIAIVILLICTALISGSEMAFFSLDSKKLEDLKNNKKYNSDNINKLVSQPQRLLATLLIANNLINISIVIIATYITVKLFNLAEHYLFGFFIEFVVITSLILLFGEMLPKIYANKYSLRFANFMASPMLFLMTLFHPLSMIMVKSTRLIEKRIAARKHDISFDDLSKAIEIRYYINYNFYSTVFKLKINYDQADKNH